MKSNIMGIGLCCLGIEVVGKIRLYFLVCGSFMKEY